MAKFEARNPKFETNPNDQKAERVSRGEYQGTRDFSLNTRHPTLVSFLLRRFS
jgi:hypothetical protein